MEPRNNTLQWLKLLSAILTLSLLITWYTQASEAEAWSTIPGPHLSSRFETLQKIAASANQGYYFQIAPGIPMESLWEDPGTAFLMVWGGIIKHLFHLGPVNVFKDPYRAELFILLLPLCLIFFTRLFDDLPNWYWLVPPLFFAWSIMPTYALRLEDFGLGGVNGLLYLSVSARWAGVPAAFWIFTLTLQFYQWWRKKILFKCGKGRLCRLVIYGFILGIFISIRKTIEVTSFAAITSCLLLLLLLSLRRKERLLPYVGKWIPLLMILCIFSGNLIDKGIIESTWAVRDKLYNIEKIPRIYGHPTWHTLYASLGLVKNHEGITWSDEGVFNKVVNDSGDKSLQYGTAKYETAVRNQYFKTIFHDPNLLMRNIAYRISMIWDDHKGNLVITLLALSLLCIFGGDLRLLSVILLNNVLMGSLILVLVNHWIHYGLDFITYYRLAMIVGFGLVALRAAIAILQTAYPTNKYSSFLEELLSPPRVS